MTNKMVGLCKWHSNSYTPQSPPFTTLSVHQAIPFKPWP